MVPMPTDPAEARKRRKEIIQSQRSEGEFLTAAAPIAESSSATTSTTTTCKKNAAVRTRAVTDKKPPKKRKVTAEEDEDDGSVASKTKTSDDFAFEAAGEQHDSDADANNRKKTQIRYDPEIPMNKEQLAAWRREARRVRNRESAAASRQRIRNRISELEDEVSQWKSKYSQAMQRLEALEAAVANNNSNSQVASAGTEV
jgi:chromosome segregation ATPase